MTFTVFSPENSLIITLHLALWGGSEKGNSKANRYKYCASIAIKNSAEL